MSVVKFPKSASEETFTFPCGSSVSLNCGEGRPLTVAVAIYLLEQVKHDLLSAEYDDE
jgi:hypothetical protein